MGPTKVRDVVMPPGPWSITGLLPVGLVSRTCLGNLYWDIVDKRPNQRSWDFDSERSVPRFRTLRLSQLGTLLRGVTQWTLRKNSISGACTGIVLFCVYLLLLPNNHNHSYGSEQRHVWKLRALRCLKTPVLLPQSTKAHAELRLLYQSVYQSPCWPSVTREYQLKAGAQPWVRGICGVCLPWKFQNKFDICRIFQRIEMNFYILIMKIFYSNSENFQNCCVWLRFDFVSCLSCEEESLHNLSKRQQ